MDNLPAKKVTDFTDKDLQKIQEFQDAGLPGLDKLSNHQLTMILEMYLEGRTYQQISRDMCTPKTLIMYLSNKFDWPTAKIAHLEDLTDTIKQRTLESKIKSQDFLLNLQHALQRRIGSKITNYFKTGSDTHIDELNLKEIDKLLKVIETIDKLDSEKRPQKSPLIGINPGAEGFTARKIGENEIEITPTVKTSADKLKEFAEKRRQEDSAKSDIKKDNSK